MADVANRHAGAAALVATILILQASAVLGAPNPRGRLLFLRCASCHDISATASPKIGPNLKGVFGRRAGGLVGYAYSPAMTSQSFVWDQATLDRWLTRPSDVVPGTAMAFGGIASEADRAALIAYLREPGD